MSDLYFGQGRLSARAAAKGSSKGTWRQNSLVNKGAIGSEKRAPPPPGVLSETPNTSRVLRLFPPLGWSQHFHSRFPSQSLNLFIHPVPNETSHLLTPLWHDERLCLPAEFLNAAPIFTSTPCDDGVEDCYTL